MINDNDNLPRFLTYKEKLPVPEKSKPQKRRFENIFEDIDGAVDDAWHESVKKYVPEVLWNPQHPDRAQTTTTKGGKGSGNWGHAGLSGVWGGSSTPTKTAPSPATAKWVTLPKQDWRSRPPRTGEDTQLENLKGHPDYANAKRAMEIAKQFSGVDPETGYYVKASWLSGKTDENNHAVLQYSGTIRDKSGKKAGSVDLSYDATTNEGKIDFIYIYKDFRKSGFGRNYIDHVETTFFEKMKVNAINLTAALDVGGYFWARAGYDFVKPSEKRKAIQWFQKEWKYRYNQDVPQKILSNLNHTWDIASVVGSDGFPIGKQAMLGVSWDGSKKYDSLGYEIGKEYYNID